MSNNIYKPTDEVIVAALKDAGVPTMIDPENLPDEATLAQMRGVLDKTVRGWKDLVDDLSLQQLAQPLYVSVTNKGRRIALEENGVGIKVNLASRTITRNRVRKQVAADLPFFEAVKQVVYGQEQYILRVRDEASNITRRAVNEFLSERGLPIPYKLGNWSDEVRVSTIVNHLNNFIDINDRQKLLVYARRAFKRQLVTPVEVVSKKDTGPQFEVFMRNKRASLRAVAGESIENLHVPAFPGDVAASRTWGIEVEAGGARGVHAPSGWDRKYDGSLHSAYSEAGGYEGSNSQYIDPMDCDSYDHREEVEDEDGNMVENPDWNDPESCYYCGDVENEDYYEGDEDDTAEFVSGILDQFHEPGLKKLTERLSEEPQNDSAGVHVHVEARDLTPKQIGGLSYAYQIIEPLIEGAYRRDVREYCKVRPQAEVLRIIRSGKTAKKLARDYNSYNDNEGETLYHGDRYVSVNLNSLSAHGTVEFRAMGPVYEYEHLIRWALFCREMVNVAKANLPAKVWNSVKSWQDVLNIFARYGTEYPAIIAAELEAQVPAAELVSA